MYMYMYQPITGQQSMAYDSDQQLSNISDSYNFVYALIFIATMLHATFATTAVLIRLNKYEYIDMHVKVVSVLCRSAFNWQAKWPGSILHGLMFARLQTYIAREYFFYCLALYGECTNCSNMCHHINTSTLQHFVVRLMCIHCRQFKMLHEAHETMWRHYCPPI